MTLIREFPSLRQIRGAGILLSLSLSLGCAAALSQSTSAPPPQPATSTPQTFIQRYQARVTPTQDEQPHWIAPLVTVTPRLEQELRTDFVHQYNPAGFGIWNYDNGKGLELIPERHTELIFNLPPFYSRSNGQSDGFGDISFLAKERIYSRNE